MSHHIKRKQINYDLLSPSSSQLCSFTSAPNQSHVEVNAIVSKKIDLEKQVKQATQNEKSWRHKYKLIENERQEYEKSIQLKYEKEKEALTIELKVVKQAHIEKIQSMSTSMLQLQKQIARLRHQLVTNGITEDIDMTINDDQDWLLNSLKEDADFIKMAHQQAMHEYTLSASHPLWASIQKNACGLKEELALLQAWKSAFNQKQNNDGDEYDDHDELESNISHTIQNKLEVKSAGGGGLKKAIFGKTHKSVKRKSAIFDK